MAEPLFCLCGQPIFHWTGQVEGVNYDFFGRYDDDYDPEEGVDEIKACPNCGVELCRAELKENELDALLARTLTTPQREQPDAYCRTCGTGLHRTYNEHHTLLVRLPEGGEWEHHCPECGVAVCDADLSEEPVSKTRLAKYADFVGYGKEVRRAAA